MQDRKHPNADELQQSESKEKYLPVDPSHTSDIGEKVETGIVDLKEGLNQQSSAWEHEEDLKIKAEPPPQLEDKKEEPEEPVEEKSIENSTEENIEDDPGFLWQNESPQTNIPGQNKI